MTNFAIARILSRMSVSALADAAGVSRSYISQLENGQRKLGKNNVQPFADLLGADRAWLLDCPDSLPVFDPIDRAMYACQIIRTVKLPDYGMLYLVHLPETGDSFAVILSHGVMFTVSDWQSADQPKCYEDIANYRWIDASGKDALMADGLPMALT